MGNRSKGTAGSIIVYVLSLDMLSIILYHCIGLVVANYKSLNGSIIC